MVKTYVLEENVLFIFWIEVEGTNIPEAVKEHILSSYQ
jgi:hypothetical protein